MGQQQMTLRYDMLYKTRNNYVCCVYGRYSYGFCEGPGYVNVRKFELATTTTKQKKGSARFLQHVFLLHIALLLPPPIHAHGTWNRTGQQWGA